MKKTLIIKARIFDGTGSEPFIGDLLVAGNRIEQVATGIAATDHGAEVIIDGSGKFLMPGMTEGHAHLSFDGFTFIYTYIYVYIYIY